MSFFSSDRERNLWLWVLVVLAWIYATLGPAYTLAAELRERQPRRITFALILLLLVVIIAWRWLKQRPGRGEIAVAIGIMIIYLWAIARVESPEERTHLIDTAWWPSSSTRRWSNADTMATRYRIQPSSPLWQWRCWAGSMKASRRCYPTVSTTSANVGFNVLAALMAILAALAMAWAGEAEKTIRIDYSGQLIRRSEHETRHRHGTEHQVIARFKLQRCRWRA